VRTIFHRIEELEDELDRVSARVSALEAKAKASKPKPAAKRTTK
jgi:BMFP domain-containing protein YqiC